MPERGTVGQDAGWTILRLMAQALVLGMARGWLTLTDRLETQGAVANL